MNTETLIQNILKNSVIADNTLKLPPEQLERNTYEKVNEVLKRLWGKWNSRKKVHEFTYDPTESIQVYIETGVLPPKNELSYFPTPDSVIQDILYILKNECKFFHNILEPSAGQGAIADELKNQYPDSNLDIVEYNELHAKVLNKKGYTPFQQDFLTYETKTQYDLIVMNPPFNVPELKNCWIDHLYKAWTLISKEGSVFCIVPAGWERKTDKKHTDFQKWISNKVKTCFVNESGTFKNSGTNIKTYTLQLLSPHEISELTQDFYGDRFSMFYNGDYGYELYRKNEHNKNKSPEEYVNYLMIQTLSAEFFFETLAYDYKSFYVQLCESLDFENNM